MMRPERGNLLKARGRAKRRPGYQEHPVILARRRCKSIIPRVAAMVYASGFKCFCTYSAHQPHTPLPPGCRFALPWVMCFRAYSSRCQKSLVSHSCYFTISYVSIPSLGPISPFVTNFVTNTPFVLSNDSMEAQYVILSISFAETM